MVDVNTKRMRRHTALTRAVIDNGSMEIEELASFLGVSLVTAYRDVNELMEEGVLNLDRGTVTSHASSAYDMPSEMRVSFEKEEKESFAPFVSRIIHRGAAVMVDDSSSVLPSLDLLVENAPITIVTNSLAVINRVGKRQSVDVHCLGGRFSGWSNSFYGSNTIAAISQYQPDFCIMSDSAIAGGYLCNAYEYVAETKRAMLESAQTNILLADHTKFERRALNKTVSLAAFDYIITDLDPGDEVREFCEAENIRLIMTKVPDPI